MIGSSNLIPLHRRRARDHERWVIRWGLVIGTWATLLLTAHVVLWNITPPGPARAAAEMTPGVEPVEGVDPLTRLRGEAATLERRLAAARQVAARPAWATLLLAVEGTLDEKVVLASLALVGLPDTTTPTPPPARVSLELTGYARSHGDVAELVLRLESLGVFRRVQLRDTRLRPLLDQAAIYFDVECILIDLAPSP